MFRCTNFFRASPEIFVPKNRLQKYFWNRYQQWISVHLLHGHWLKKPWVTPLLHHAKPIISPSFEHIIQCFPRYFIFYLTSPIDKNFHKISMLGFFWAFSAIFPWFYKDNKGAPEKPTPLGTEKHGEIAPDPLPSGSGRSLVTWRPDNFGNGNLWEAGARWFRQAFSKKNGRWRWRYLEFEDVKKTSKRLVYGIQSRGLSDGIYIYTMVYAANVGT